MEFSDQLFLSNYVCIEELALKAMASDSCS